ncbi:MAG: N-acetyltransferase [Candidatus Dadabacteria bacterium]|nr:MAG: N-acetyltransferase [Candidatus Dadabacteria bacterium]
MGKNSVQLRFYFRPGFTESEAECGHITAAARRVAKQCFPTLPEYQCLSTDPNALNDKVISIAYDRDGEPIGFCSSVILPVRGVGDVLHLGLTCVGPQARGLGLTHKLTAHALTQYVLRYRPVGRTWISNVACVLSSLGNVALNFENVYPSPNGPARPGITHRRIARAIDLHYRRAAYIHEHATFDPEGFVFRRSVAGTVFEKEATDRRYHHRYDWLNRYYHGLMRMEQGDEVLQVGYVTLLTAFKHAMRRRRANAESSRYQLAGA